ncbi:MAG: hypothetical protein ABSA52_09535 [Candidatus Binatia bacterium]|jgi:hypothetical protein
MLSAKDAIMNDQAMTLAQIEAQFEAEWVLIEDPDTDATLAVRGGTVCWHSKDRDEVYRKAVELRPHRFAVVYTGKMPKDTAIVLAAAVQTPRKQAVRMPGGHEVSHV